MTTPRKKKGLKAIVVDLINGTTSTFDPATQYKNDPNSRIVEVWTPTGYHSWPSELVVGFHVEFHDDAKVPVTPQQPDKPLRPVDNRKCEWDMHRSCKNPDCQCECGHKNSS